MAGINKDVQILGLTFHVQTEILTTNRPTVHTVVFRSGRAVAAKDREISAAEIAEKGERALAQEQQNAVIASLRERAQRFNEERSGQRSTEEPGEEPLAEPAAESTAEPIAEPIADRSDPRKVDSPSSEDLAEVLRIRRMLGELRQRLNIERAEARLQPGARIEHAARCFDWILEHRLFTELRVFEQVQFHVIRTRITSWSAAGSQPAQADAIWMEVIGFFDHLLEINHREDLMAFDRELLSWGIAEIEQQGPSAEIGTQLRQLSGLAPKLDAFLGGVASDDGDEWLAPLRVALEELDRI